MPDAVKPSPPRSLAGGNAFVILGNHHVRLEGFATRLSTWPAPERGSPLRSQWIRSQVEAFRHHLDLEHEQLWPVVRRTVRGGDRLASMAVDHRHRAAPWLDALAGDPGTVEPAQRVAACLRQHVAFEEERVWPLLWETLGLAEAAALSGALGGSDPGSETVTTR
jgi:hypothetical protein